MAHATLFRFICGSALRVGWCSDAHLKDTFAVENFTRILIVHGIHQHRARSAFSCLSPQASCIKAPGRVIHVRPACHRRGKVRSYFEWGKEAHQPVDDKIMARVAGLH